MAAGTLITGASGLIGTWVLHHWSDTGTTPMPVRHADVDLLAPGAAADLVARTTPAQVVHLAWSASGNADYRTSDDNDRWLTATLELVEAARSVGSAVWLTGTAVDDATDATDAYTRSKAGLKARLAPLIEASVVGWLRPYYVFDEARRRPALVDLAVTTRERGETLHLRSPHQHHDFVHASDVGRAIVASVTHGLTGEVPIGSGRLRSVADLVTRLDTPWSADQAELDTPPTHSGDVADTTRLAAVGWEPTRTEEFFTHG
ncbi:NAD-dependent epimerase/dehydratase family protein [Nocardioides pinisoli]|uniref:NAD-dependent epimerase/dehydratase family protein n=1 Tax=Nocardioides pinisoli TaxID=2950279 RepID=A0ABT1KY37_9ACTN|nr:NAD-dependent epimerase/dehydratase family protein [Nocardioides pinisoli]MCP3422547.1 NAD-dependent epimerase/dehydratase family protein [Nocardioides pinisoli]